MGRLSATILKKMNKEDKKRVLDEVATGLLAGLSQEEKCELINGWMDRFFADMTTEDKQRIVENIMPRIKDGFNTALILPQMLAAVMGAGQQNSQLTMMPTMVSRETEGGSSGEHKGESKENA